MIYTVFHAMGIDAVVALLEMESHHANQEQAIRHDERVKMLREVADYDVGTHTRSLLRAYADRLEAGVVYASPADVPPAESPSKLHYYEHPKPPTVESKPSAQAPRKAPPPQRVAIYRWPDGTWRSMAGPDGIDQTLYVRPDLFDAARSELAEARRMFDVTRHQVLTALGEADMGKGWNHVPEMISSMKSALHAHERALSELQAKLDAADSWHIAGRSANEIGQMLAASRKEYKELQSKLDAQGRELASLWREREAYKHDKTKLEDVRRMASEHLDAHLEPSPAQRRADGPPPPPCDCRFCQISRALLAALPVVEGGAIHDIRARRPAGANGALGAMRERLAAFGKGNA